MKLALISTLPALALDDDLPPLLAACTAAGLDAEVLAWDDPTVSWRRFDAVLLRSPWDYVERLPDFLDWCARVAGQTRLINPLPVIRANTDKHYLAALERAGIAIVPSRFAEPGCDAGIALSAFLSDFPTAREFVVKPAIGAGSRDAQRYGREQTAAATPHIRRLLEQRRSVLLQPYLDSVDDAGETALIYFGGHYSHAIRKGALLKKDEGSTSHLFAPEAITARTPGDDERTLADRIVASLPELFGLDQPLVYARIDLIRAQDGSPRLLELELTEPSLFFGFAEGSAARLVQALSPMVIE